ncbi:hypothetical protein [Alphaproteobacteria bacterium endosymbiont of Tiliacea citrago]
MDSSKDLYDIKNIDIIIFFGDFNTMLSKEDEESLFYGEDGF